MGQINVSIEVPDVAEHKASDTFVLLRRVLKRIPGCRVDAMDYRSATEDLGDVSAEATPEPAPEQDG